MALEPKPPGPDKTTLGQIGPKLPPPPSAPIPPAVDPLTQKAVSGSLSPINRRITNAFIESHAYDGTRRDLTPFVQSANWTNRVSEPWTTIEARMVLPWAQRAWAPKPGDWLVVYDHEHHAVAWGVVDDAPSPGIEGAPQGVRASKTISVRAMSWLSLIARAQVFASPYALAAIPKSIGSYFDAEDWTARVMTLADSVVGGDLGNGLKSAVSTLLNLRLPPTLGGGLLASAVNVVYDNASAANAKLDWLACDPVMGPRIMGVDSFFPASTNLLDVLLGMFVPDRQMIEFWETLAPALPQSEAARDALGSVPTLVYRIRPWRSEPLGDFLRRDKSRRSVISTPTAVNSSPAPQTQSTQPFSAGNVLNAGTANAVQGALAQISGQQTIPDPDATLVAAYSSPTWQPAKGNRLQYDADAIDFPTPMRADAERVNTVTLGLPTQADSPVRFWKGAGLPFMNAQSVDRWGVRLYQPNWPYFPPTPTKALANQPMNPNQSVLQRGVNAGAQAGLAAATASQNTLVGYIYTIAGLGAMMMLGRERFYRGTFTTGTVDTGLRVGVPSTIAWPGFSFTAYTEAIQHIVTFNGPAGACNGYSVVSYSRGVYDGVDEREGAEREAETVPSRQPTAVVRPAATNPSTRCTKGKPAAAWPTSLSGVVSNAATTKLQAWAVTRGFKASDFGTTGSSRWQHVIVSAAAARVIEYYWQQNNESARFRLLSGVRAADPSGDPNGNHSSGSSIDYSVLLNNSPIGVLQTWTTLFRLSHNKRLPLGGRGLYLNISPGGITGVQPQQAGRSSSIRKPGPGGSSAGVHYDYRGTFGFRPDAPQNQWVALDTTGDGRDEYMLGGQNSAETLPTLTAYNPDLTAYYLACGGTDTTLAPVSNTVPNVLQLLGLEDWCPDA